MAIKHLKNTIYNGDCAKVMREKIEENSVDLIASDVPYELTNENLFDLDEKDQLSKSGFMNQGWDKLPTREACREMLRVLKPGSFAFFLMTDNQISKSVFIKRLHDSGFYLDFSEWNWAYKTGFTKSQNVAKALDKRSYDRWIQSDHESTKEYLRNWYMTLKRTKTTNTFTKSDPKITDTKGALFRLKKWKEAKNEDVKRSIDKKIIEKIKKQIGSQKGSLDSFTKGIDLDSLKITNEKELEKLKHLINLEKELEDWEIYLKAKYWIHTCWKCNGEGCSECNNEGEYKVDFKNGRPIEHLMRRNRSYQTEPSVFSGDRVNDSHSTNTHYYPATLEAKYFYGLYSGSQPKPAKEAIIIAMKPLTEKTDLDHILKHKKGGLHFDRARIPYGELEELVKQRNHRKGYCTKGIDGVLGWNTEDNLKGWNSPSAEKFKKKLIGGRAKHDISFGLGEFQTGFKKQAHKEGDYHNTDVDLRGRFPANLWVSDDALGKDKFAFSMDLWFKQIMDRVKRLPKEHRDSFPYFFVPKPLKKEKNKGLQNEKGKKVRDGRKAYVDNPFQRGECLRKNTNPCTKPISIMSLLILIGSEEGDTVLDCYMGSGTTLCACNLTNRKGIGIDISKEFCGIAYNRQKAWKRIPTLMSFLDK